MKLATRLLGVWLLAWATAGAVEYFVAVEGSDQADGLSPAAAFATIQRGLDVLQPGDTLTILPGEYEQNASREDLGSADAVTTIRAAIPGTVLLRGDVAAPEFGKVPGTLFTWQAPFDRDVQAVNELDTLTILLPVGSAAELDYQPGRFFYDKAAGVLKISASDLQPPDTHRYRVAVTNAHGLYLERPVQVVIDGLAVTGFNRASGGSNYPGYSARWGILLGSPTKSVIRNCTAFLNGGGIGLHNRGEGSGGSLIDGCVSYANYCRENNGGNILGYTPSGDIIRNSYSFRTRLNGIRLYGGHHDGNHHIGNLAWGSGWSDINTKATKGRMERSVAIGAGSVLETDHSLIGGTNSYHFGKGTPPDTIRLAEEENLDPDAEFADPVNLDFRLQSTSRFRNAAPDGSDCGPYPYTGTIFYVRPDGDDGADGLSLASAWRTLRRAEASLSAGDTLYLSGGVYSGGLQLRLPAATDGGIISLRGRGTDDVLIEGPVILEGGAGFSLGRLHFADTITVAQCAELRSRNVFFSGKTVGLQLDQVGRAFIRHSVFARAADAGMTVVHVPSLFVSGVLFNTGEAPAIVFDEPVWSGEGMFYSNYNSFGSENSVWAVADGTLSLEDVRQLGSERQSRVQPAEIIDESGIVRIGNPLDFADGPLGFGIGYYRETQFLEGKAELVMGPIVHSTSATSTNIEWWSAEPMVFELAWGTTPELGESIRFEGDGFNTQSITGLQPGTTYYFRLRTATKQLVHPDAAVPSADVHVLAGTSDGQERYVADFSGSDAQLFTVTTPAQPAAPRILYVATDGSDSNNGLSRETPLRTINRAAELVRPGDTVLIAGGHYPETVRARVTGTKEAPIRFTALPGERVVIDGSDRSLTGNLIVDGKEYLEFDYLWMIQSGGTAIRVNRGGHHQFTRCFFDGRGRGNAPMGLKFVAAEHVEIRNCVINNFFSAFHVTHCPDFTVEHCVFTRNWIYIASVYNGENENFIFRKNIVTDNQPDKRNVHFFEICFASSMVMNENCYYVRPRDGDRPVFFIIDQPGDSPHARNRMEQVSLQQFDDQYGDSHSIFANPGFPVWANVDTTKTTRSGDPVFPADTVPRGDLNFSDFFTTNPILIERDIGLQPQVF